MKRWSLNALLCAAILGAAPAAGQSSRRTLIEQARNEFTDSVRLRLLMSAIDPALGPPDSLMAVAGYDLAASLIRSEQRELAATWLRWLARHASRWPIDRNWYPASTTTAYDQAVTSTRSNPDSARTSWRWPSRFAANAQGSIQATTIDGSAAFTVSIAGRTATPAAGTVTLPAGTYTVTVSADGYESAQLIREVLPGVATSLQLELLPALSASVQSDVGLKLVRISYADNNQQVCQNGLLAGSDGLVLTTFAALMGRSGLQVSAFNGQETFRDVPVVATDEARNLAVLKLNTQRAQPIPAADRVSSEQHAWAVHFDGCDNSSATRTRLTAWPAAPVSQVPLATSVGANAVGAALVDRSGLLIGLISSPDAVLPAALTLDILERARRPVAIADPPQPPPQVRTRRFPWMWAGAGVAAAGLTVALLGGGGSNGPKPTTGGIVITIPN